MINTGVMTSKRTITSLRLLGIGKGQSRIHQNTSLRLTVRLANTSRRKRMKSLEVIKKCLTGSTGILQKKTQSWLETVPLLTGMRPTCGFTVFLH
jgi:hypothetical protein